MRQLYKYYIYVLSRTISSRICKYKQIPSILNKYLLRNSSFETLLEEILNLQRSYRLCTDEPNRRINSF